MRARLLADARILRACCVVCLLGVAGEGRARAQGVAFHESPDPALAAFPPSGDLMLHLGQAAAYTSAAGWTGVVTPGATWGVSLFDVLTPLTLRLELPVLEERGRVRLGSALATAGITTRNLELGPVAVGAVLESGIVAPSFGGETVEIAGNPLAGHDAQGYLAASVPVTLLPLGVTAVFWSTSFAVANVELDYVVHGRSPVWLRAGVGLPFRDQSARWFAGTATGLTRQLQLGASASAANETSRGVLVELSLRWSTPTDPMPTVPWADADARVLLAEEVRGRDVEALGVPGKTTVIELGATWCGPCHQVHPFLRRLARRPNVAVRFVDADECPEFVKRYDPTGGLPMFLVIDPRGALVRTAFGADPHMIDGLVAP
jgi:thiol-disulfide isomerase/thioredoxin